MSATASTRPRPDRRRHRWSAGPLTPLAVFAAVLALLGLGLTAPSASAATTAGHLAAPHRVHASHPAGSRPKPVVRYALRHDLSPPLRSIKPVHVRHRGKIRVIPFHNRPLRVKHPANTPTARVQTRMGPDTMPAFQQNFDGVSSGPPNPCNCQPPDTNMAVGPNDVVQTVNTAFGIWDKQGNVLLSPEDLGTVWEGLGGACDPSTDPQAYDGGDPVVMYDEQANRWFISQLSYPSLRGGNGGFHACMAVSQTGDPTGAYFRYDFLFSQDTLNDYPKFGVWPDGYYMSVDDFLNGSAFTGVTAVAFNRQAMLAGQPAQSVSFTLGSQYFRLLPSNWEGADLGENPPAGSPNPFFMECDPNAGGPCSGNQLDEWDFHVDWANPANSTFGNNGAPNLTLPTASFNTSLGPIPQPGTSGTLDSLSGGLMYQAAYRNLGSTQAVVLSQSVNAAANPATGQLGGINWYELTNSGSGWSIGQQGTYAPDSDNRWMPSINIDASGDVAVGYSVSSSTTDPSIRVAGRLAGDPAGQLSQGEETLLAGTQSSSNFRWGDYSAMQVDPIDGCTFWYTTEYPGSAPWNTRIGSFKYPSCTSTPPGTISGTVTDAGTGKPVAHATVAVTGGDVNTNTITDGQGNYSIIVPSGTYTETFSGFGYVTQTVSGVQVTSKQNTTENEALPEEPSTHLTGTVTDASGHGWPLYASISVQGDPAGPSWTNPATGQYDIRLPQNGTYSITYTPSLPGYQSTTDSVTVGTSDVTHNATVPIDTTGCTAEGYTFNANLSEGFDAGGTTPPNGWTVVNNLSNADQWRFDDPQQRGNLTGGQGGFAIADAQNSTSSSEDTSLISPVVDLSGESNPVLDFHTDYAPIIQDPSFAASVDVSTDGGQTWTTAWSNTTGISGPDLEKVALPQAANQSQVQVRFHFTGLIGFWEVDDVGLGTCAKVPGGLVVGKVRDTNTSAAVNEATVTSSDNPSDTTTTAATPDDPAVGGGYYQMFSHLTGSHPVTVTKTLANGAGWAPTTQTVNVAADGTTEADFNLPAGQLSVSPTSVSNSLVLGKSTATTVQITNTGTSAATFALGERQGAFGLLDMQGATLHRVQLPRGQRASPGWMGGRKATAKPGTSAEPLQQASGNTWSTIAGYPDAQGIMDNSADYLDGNLYSVGGFDSAVVNTANAYNVYTDTWKQLASMPVAREKPGVAFVNGKLYVAGGWDSNGFPVPEADVYDPSSNSWSPVSAPPNPTAAPGVAAVGGKIYFVGGCLDPRCSSTDETTTRVLRYDPATDNWATVAPYPHNVAWESCGGIGNKVYCAGGTDGVKSYSDAFQYDPATNSWSAIASLPADLWGSSGGSANGLLVLSGGVTSNGSTITNQGFAYDPSTNTWAALPNAQVPVLRAGGACGFYKIGGDTTGNFAPTTTSEALSGLDQCGTTSLPWLSASPASGTLQPGQSTQVTVGLTATPADGVSQPGTYTAQLAASQSTPYLVAPVNITMTVTPPLGWGKVTGTVTGVTCTGTSAPLHGAQVQASAKNNFALTQFTGPPGTYGLWGPAGDNPFRLTASLAGWSSRTLKVNVKAGKTVTANFTLNQNCG